MTSTPEVRVDPLTGLRVVLAPARADRPGALAAVTAPAPIDREQDPFAAGHEDRTPPELGRVDDGAGGWRARAFANRFPAWTPDAAAPERDARPDLFTGVAATGAHEVIVNSPEPVQSLAELDTDQVQAAAGLWAERMRTHDGASYVHLHVNERPEGGASLPHTHAQLHALDFVPAAIARERERASAHATRTLGNSLLGELVQEEVRRRARLIAYDDEAVLLAPFASRTPFQLMVAPRTPRPHWQDGGPAGVALLHDGLRRLQRRFGASPPLTLWIRTAPQGAEHFSWRIDVLPRLAPMAGLELGTGVHVLPVAPEVAAAELRDAA